MIKKDGNRIEVKGIIFCKISVKFFIYKNIKGDKCSKFCQSHTERVILKFFGSTPTTYELRT